MYTNRLSPANTIGNEAGNKSPFIKMKKKIEMKLLPVNWPVHFDEIQSTSQNNNGNPKKATNKNTAIKGKWLEKKQKVDENENSLSLSWTQLVEFKLDTKRILK